MKRMSIIVLSIFLLLLIAGFIHKNSTETDGENASGRIIGGYRVLSIARDSQNVRLTVYRGDYIRFAYDGAEGRPVLSIPELSISETLSHKSVQAPYFKMKKTGTFAFSLGNASGTIAVVEYKRPSYEAISAQQAAEMIRNIHPFILDVRTSREHREGHLENATLIPVQELQSRLAELSKFKNDDILIYCATGNRSTVAAKILIDNGFKRVFNLRYGIEDWKSKKGPVVR